MPLMPTRMSAASHRCGQAAAGELIEPRFERHAIERREGQRRENLDTPPQAGVKLIQQRRALDRAAGEFRGVRQRPGGRHRHVAEIRAFLAVRRVAKRDDEIHARRIGPGEFMPGLAAQFAGVVAERVAASRSLRHWAWRSDRIRPSRRGSAPPPYFSRMASAMIERAELCVQRNSTLKAGGHALILFRPWGKEAREIAAQFGAAAAAGFGEKAEQLPQADDARGMNDLPPLTGRLRETRALQRREMKRGGRGGQAEAAREIARRQTRSGLPPSEGASG